MRLNITIQQYDKPLLFTILFLSAFGTIMLYSASWNESYIRSGGLTESLFLHFIISLIKEFENDFGDVESIGIGMPGCVSQDSSLVKNANSVWLNGKPLKIDLEKLFTVKWLIMF